MLEACPEAAEDRGKMDGLEGHTGSEKQLQSIYEKERKNTGPVPVAAATHSEGRRLFPASS